MIKLFLSQTSPKVFRILQSIDDGTVEVANGPLGLLMSGILALNHIRSGTQGIQAEEMVDGVVLGRPLVTGLAHQNIPSVAVGRT